MTRTRSLLLLLALVAVAALGTSPAASAADGSSPAATAAAKKKSCKKGYRVVKVRRKGRVRRVCRRRVAKKPGAQRPTPQGPAPAPAPSGPAGPSVAEVEQIIRELAQANVRYGFPESTVEVTFERPTQIGAMEMYDPYEGDPLHAGGPIEAWPVKAWVKQVGHYDDTPEDDTDYAGCLGHLNSYWPYDSLYMFYRDETGSWAFRTSSAKPGDCG